MCWLNWDFSSSFPPVPMHVPIISHCSSVYIIPHAKAHRSLHLAPAAQEQDSHWGLSLAKHIREGNDFSCLPFLKGKKWPRFAERLHLGTMCSSGWKPGFALGDTFQILSPWLSAGQSSFIILLASHGAQGLHNHSKVEVGWDLRKLSCPSPGSSSRVNYSRFPRTLPSWVFKISKAGSWGTRAQCTTLVCLLSPCMQASSWQTSFLYSAAVERDKRWNSSCWSKGGNLWYVRDSRVVTDYHPGLRGGL